jgi:hypothetical protein
MKPRLPASALLASALIVCGARAAGAVTLFDPALRFRVLRTDHFAIYFHKGEEPMARRLTTIAEETWRTLQRPLGVQPPKLTHVVLADQTEFANGYATPFPYDTVVIYTVWPSGSEFDFADWLRLAFVHEFTHIVHLDRSEGWAHIARRIVGRAPYAFPNLFLPLWQIEGLATYEESQITGYGRLHAGDHRAIVGEAARAGRLEPLDRVNGGLTDWPAGATQYAYGVGFHEYLANRFGTEKIGELADATARRFPYTSTKAFEYVYGEPLGDLWREYEASLLESTHTPPPSDPQLERLTKQGFWVSGPRFDRFTCAGCAPGIVFSARNPDGFPSLYQLALDGSAPRKMAERYLGSTTGIGRDAIYFNQLERRRNVGFYSDLYALSRWDGSVRRLTSEARLLDPDLSPDETTIVCTQARSGQRDLVLVRLKPDTTEERDTTDGKDTTRGKDATDGKDTTGGKDTTDGKDATRGKDDKDRTRGKVVSGFSRTITALVSEPDVYFDAPRWSPDGRTIVAERHRLDAMPEIVLVDVPARSVRALASDSRVRFTTPTWRPDGGAIIAAAAPEDETFNLVEVPVNGSPMRQLTHVAGGAIWPEVSPDGQTIVFAGYTADGYDLFSLPYPRQEREAIPRSGSGSEAWGRAYDARLQGSRSAEPAALPERQGPAETQRPSAPYNPLPTLVPTWWTPVISNDGVTVRAGGSISASDVLGYHGYSASASWLVTSTTTSPRPSQGLPDWQLYYAYDRWRPRLYALSSSTTTFSTGPALPSGAPSDSTERATSLEAGVFFPIVHARTAHSAFASVGRARNEFTFPDTSLTRDRTPLRASWEAITSRRYGYSISDEGGIAASATAEAVRRAFWSDGDATTYTADLRAYLPGVRPHQVVALRASGGVSNGDPTVGRTFLLGGAASAERLGNFSSRSSSLLRGFPDATFAGSRVALVNAEYRFPAYRLQRGIGTWPIFFHTIHGAVFADAGETWSTAFRADAVKTSAGVEASCDVVAAYLVRLTIALGGAIGHDRSGAVPARSLLYFRIGKAF